MQTLKSRKLSPTDLLSSSLAVVYIQVTGSIGKTRDGGVGFVASAVQATGGGPM